MPQKPKPTKARPRRAKIAKVSVRRARCPACDSTKRTPYHSITTTEVTGSIEGEAYTRIVRKRTSCKACGLPRVEMHYENDGSLK
ncbi:MAG: hypothetical protein Aurels2KO_25400 [Aureliella sp.]